LKSEYLIVGLPILTALLGAIAGAFLRPWAEALFNRKKNKIRIDVFDKNPTSFIKPGEEISIQWNGQQIDELRQIGFEIQNKSGSKITNFKLEITTDEYYGDPHDFFEVYMDEPQGTKWREIDSDRKTKSGLSAYSVFAFDYIENKSKIVGSVVTNGSSKVMFGSPSEVELIVTSDAGNDLKGYSKILEGVIGAASVGSVAAAITSFTN